MTLQQLAEGFSNSNAKSVGARRQYMQELRDSMSLSAQAESAPQKYREIVRQVIEIDFPTEVDKAIRSARESLRNLQGSASLDAETLAEIDAQMNGLGDELANSVDALQSMRSEMTTALREAHIDREELAEQWQESLDELLARVEPIRDSALERAQQLSAMRDQENALRQEQWQVELAQFETTLHESVCEYSVVLRDLPDGEHLSLILKGLGNRESGSSEDRVIVFSKADLLRCQSGDISAQQLQQLAERYSF
jgi:DNA repair exonuclease SbcCD ATPase subunit